MGIDLATWRARIGLNYYHRCRPLQTSWRSSGGWVYQPGAASWGVGQVLNDTPLVLKGCMTVVALSLILKYVLYFWSKLKWRSRGGKVRCHWRGYTSRVKGILDGGGTLLLRAIVVAIPLLLVMAGDVETNPGPGGTVFEGEGKLYDCQGRIQTLKKGGTYIESGDWCGVCRTVRAKSLKSLRMRLCI